MAKKIKVFIKRVGREPTMEVIDNELSALQGIVGGYIETCTLGNGRMVIICNEEGFIKNLPYSASVSGIMFRGNLVFAGVDGDEFADVPLSYGEFKKQYPTLWEEED